MPESDPCISLVERAVTLFFSGERKVLKDLSVSLPCRGLSHHTSLCWTEEWDHTQHLVSKGKDNLLLSGWSCGVSYRKPGWWLEGAETRESGKERERSGIASSSLLLPAVNKGVWDTRQHKQGNCLLDDAQLCQHGHSRALQSRGIFLLPTSLKHSPCTF